MELKNLYRVLETTPLDPAVGIRLALLSGGDAFALFGAEIAPGTRLSAHVHHEGPEIYYILAGSGQMCLGQLHTDGTADWTQQLEVHAGDCFTVAPGQPHQLHNPGPKPLNALFACSPTHLTTDRTVLP
jgi:mannose-6-phosphate isomerase-like protein (cupin superfamily)